MCVCHAVVFPMQAHDALVVDLALTPTATAWRATALQRGALLAWRDHTAAAAQKRLQEAAHQRTWSRVRGWLTELEGGTAGGTDTDAAAALAGGLEHSSSSIRMGLSAGLGAAGGTTGAQGSPEGSYQLEKLAAGGSDWAMGGASGVACSEGGSCGGDWEAAGPQTLSAGAASVGVQRPGGRHGGCRVGCLGVGVGAVEVEVDVSMWEVDVPDDGSEVRPNGPGPHAGGLEDGEGRARHWHGGGGEWQGGWASGEALHSVSEGVGGEGSVGDLAALTGWFEAAGRAINTLSSAVKTTEVRQKA